jgi:flagellar protein FlaF
MDPRSTEAWALSEASRRLVLAAKADDKGESLRAALILNQRLWSIFQGALIDPSSPLPKHIRDNVLALSIMMDRHLMQRLSDLDGSKIQPILDINRAIAEGLSADAPAAPATAGTTAGTPAPAAQPLPATGTHATPVMNFTA